jgi:hypothetical protein
MLDLEGRGQGAVVGHHQHPVGPGAVGVGVQGALDDILGPGLGRESEAEQEGHRDHCAFGTSRQLASSMATK